MTTPRVVERPDDVGPVLREVRIAEQITQVALAQLAGVGRQWLNAFEMGAKPSAPLDMVMRIVAALDAPITLARPAPRAPSPIGEPIDLDALLREYDQ
jgi:transcriptional regulator with XRE-family HTH domain